MKYTFHLIGLAHLPTAKKYLSCAFTCKNVKMARMLCDLGHTVYLYGCRSTEDEPLETYIDSNNFHFVEVLDVSDIRKDYGDGDNRFEIGYDFTNCDYRHDFNSSRNPSTLKFYKNCIDKINKVKKPDHFLLLSQGAYHRPIRDAVGLFLNCEPGIGYRGSLADNFRAFESSYIQNFSYGSAHPYECINGSYYDRVIPNYIDPEDVEFSDDPDDYYLFIGRMIKRKGILTAALACNAIGKKLIIVGQGASVDSRGYLVPNDTPDFELAPGTWEYVGYCDVEKRKRLMSKSIATFTPTEYLECFASTHVESMLSGTPAITTNFGVFPGTIPECVNGKVGFRCNTLQDFVDAAIAAEKVNRYEVRLYGERFLMGTVMWEFQKWFDDLFAVYQSTIDKTIKAWHRLTIPTGNGMMREENLFSLTH